MLTGREGAAMIWVRGPVWDLVWLLSGLPIGLAVTVLVLCGVPYFWMLAAAVIVFQTAHTISPICLAWSHAGFRRIMLGRPCKFILVPIALLVSWTFLGWAAALHWPNPTFDPLTFKLDLPTVYEPLWLMGIIYSYWNIYHFGKQNFGVMSIYRRKNAGLDNGRSFDLVFCCTMCWAAMAVPTVHVAANYFRWNLLRFQSVLVVYIAIATTGCAVMLWREWRRFCLPRAVLILTNAVGMGSAMLWGLGGLGIVSMNHWLTAIGLAGIVSRRAALFPVIVVGAGTALFCALFIRGWVIPTRVAGAAVAFRLALGIVHFLYDRWVWKFSDPQVRAAIGCDVFHRPVKQPANIGGTPMMPS